MDESVKSTIVSLGLNVGLEDCRHLLKVMKDAENVGEYSGDEKYWTRHKNLTDRISAYMGLLEDGRNVN